MKLPSGVLASSTPRFYLETSEVAIGNTFMFFPPKMYSLVLSCFWNTPKYTPMRALRTNIIMNRV